MRNESDLLDRIEDARSDFRRWQVGMRSAIGALLASIAAVLVGSAVPHAGLGIALCVTGGLGILASLMFGGIWLTVHMDGEHPEKALRRAEREHRNYVMREVS